MIDVHGGYGHDPDEAPGVAIGGGSAAFASAIALRARLRGVRAAPIARVLRRATRVEPRRGAPAGVTFAPVLRFTVLAGRGGAERLGAREHRHESYVSRVARVIASPAPAARAAIAVTAPGVVATVGRLAARGRRSDGGVREVLARTRTRAGDPVREHLVSPAVRPVARVLRARAPVSDATIAQEPRVAPGKPNGAPSAPALSASEVNRLTEHVLRTMDRRISAFRERQGRS